MRMVDMLKKQTVFPSFDQLNNLPELEDILVPGYNEKAGTGQGTDRFRAQCYKGDTFILIAGEGYTSKDIISHHTMGSFINIHIRLTNAESRHVFNQFGEFVCDRPQLIIHSGPPGMLKIEEANKNTYNAAINLYVLSDFFMSSMNLDPDGLPTVLRNIVCPDKNPFVLHCMPLMPDMVFAARSVMAADRNTTLGNLYHQTKAIELMCLVINHLINEEHGGGRKKMVASKIKRLHEVREFLNQHYMDHITLDILAKQAGLGKTTLTSGFLQLFGLSIFDYIQQARMSRAHTLLQHREHSIAEVADAVGYNHSSNFSTAFRNYFGCSPQDISID